MSKNSKNILCYIIIGVMGFISPVHAFSVKSIFAAESVQLESHRLNAGNSENSGHFHASIHMDQHLENHCKNFSECGAQCHENSGCSICFDSCTHNVGIVDNLNLLVINNIQIRIQSEFILRLGLVINTPFRPPIRL